jgi:hypothetical protein
MKGCPFQWRRKATSGWKSLPIGISVGGLDTLLFCIGDLGLPLQNVAGLNSAQFLREAWAEVTVR